MKITQNLKKILLSGVAAATCITAVSAEEQKTTTAETENLLENIIVVGKRQQYRGDVPIQSMPQNIQVLESDFLSNIGITGLANALDLSASVARQNNFGGLWDAYAVRGFSGDENVPSGYLVNGFNGGRGFGGPRDASNIQRIEILKGPNAAIFGRGEPGGTVNIITKKPQFDSEGSIALTAGRWNSYRIEGDYTTGVTDKIAVRINGAYEQSDGFRDFTDSKSYTISPSILFNVTENTSLSYEGEFVDKEIPFDRGTIAIDGELGLVPRSRFFGEPGDGPVKLDVSGHQVELKHDFGNDWAFLVGFAHRKTHMVGFSSDTELSGGRQQLYQDGETLMRQRRYRDYSTKHMVMRAEISGTFDMAGMTHHVMVGTDYEKLDLDLLRMRWRNPWGVATQNLPLADVYAINIFNPVYGNSQTVAPLAHNRETQKSFGFYLNDQIDLTDKLKLRVGGRFDDFKQEVFNVLGNAPRTPQDLSSVSLQAGLVYDVSDNVTIYSVYGEGFRPNSGTSYAGETFAPEDTTSYEIGVKFGNDSGSLNGTASIFYMEKTNILTADPVNSGFTITAGDARSQGFEFDLNGQITDNLTYLISYAYIDAEYTKGVADKDFARAIEAGDPLINVPKHSASITLMYDTTIGDLPVNIGTSAQFVGERLGQTATTYMLPSYELVKVFASIEPVENFKLTLTIDNIFDTNYWPQSYGDLWTAQGEPLSWSIRGAYKF